MANIWLVTNRKLVQQNMVEVIERLCWAGIDGVILREKDLTPRQLYYLAKEIKSISDKKGTKFIVNGSAEVALAVNADGVHLGGNALPLEAVRTLVPTDYRIGVSVHATEEAENAFKSGADYLLAGNVFPTECKLGLPGRGLTWLRDMVKAVPEIPVYAIGGLNEDNIKEVLAAGAAGVALMSGLLQNPKPEKLISMVKEFNM